MVDYFSQIYNNVVSSLQANGWKILLVIAIVLIAFFLIRLLAFLLRKILYKTKIDDAVVIFFSAIFKVLLWAGTILLIFSLLEISTSSMLVALSSIALAIGLALKDSLSNLANGILIIFNKPFKRGDHVSIEGDEGKILNIRLLTTEILCFDNKKIVLPNSKVVNGSVVNFTAMPTRRVSRTFTVSYSSDIDKVTSILYKLLENDNLVLKTPKPDVFMSNHCDSSLEFTVRCWVKTEDYWTIYNSLPTKVFKTFAENNVEIPFPQLDVHFDKEEK